MSDQLNIKAGNLQAIIYHLEQGEENASIGREALAKFLRSIKIQPGCTFPHCVRLKAIPVPIDLLLELKEGIIEAIATFDGLDGAKGTYLLGCINLLLDLPVDDYDAISLKDMSTEERIK